MTENPVVMHVGDLSFPQNISKIGYSKTGDLTRYRSVNMPT